jgi:hypothetical protein
MRICLPILVAMIAGALSGCVSTGGSGASSDIPNYMFPFKYPSIEAARADILSKRRFSVTTESGWTIAWDAKANDTWYFSTPQNAAHPVIVRREFRKNGTGTGIACQGLSDACETLKVEFRKQTSQLKAEDLKSPIPPPSKLRDGWGSN